MGEAENLLYAAQALSTTAQTYVDAATETMGLTGSAIALGRELSTTWKGKAADSFMKNLDQLSGDSFNLMNAFNEASAVMNGLAQAIQANLAPIRTAEKLQQQAEGFEQLTPEVLQKLSQAQETANTAMATITYLANSAAGSLEAMNTVGTCSTGLGVFNLDIQTPSKDGKTTIIVDGKPLLVIDEATGDILENNAGGGSGGGGNGGGGGGNGGGDQPWWHEWWGRDASLWKRIAMKAAIGYSVSGISNGANALIQGKPWNWESWFIQGTVLSAGYESSILFGFKGPVDKIYSSVITAVYGSLAYKLGIGGGKKEPHPTPEPSPSASGSASRPGKSSTPTPKLSPVQTPTPTPSLSPSAPTPAPIH